MGAEGAGTLVLFLEEAPRETPLFHRLTPTQRAPKAAEGRRRLPMAADRVGTLVLFLADAPSETAVFRHEYPPQGAEGRPTLAQFSLKNH